ncbi:hypothetical protein ACOPJQ_02350 [Luteimonas dalianensis]|uniref:hypothetical protein n=1 Tax=Luteimonas dalianensis TaxID=1148196 RepID=UPI003BF28142
MRTLYRLIGVLMVAAGCLGAVACTWALIDPSIITGAGGSWAAHAPSPRWRAAFGLVFSIALVLFGSGRLRHRRLP